jgi:hypothetical protein
MSKELRICEYENCGIEFEPKRADQVFCCSRHRYLAWRQKQRKGVYRITNEKTVSKVLYFRNPIGGKLTPVSEIGKEYPLELVEKIVKGGNRGISWKRKTDGGLKELEHQLIFTFHGLEVRYNELDHCTFFWKCLFCERDPNTQCPDKVRGLAMQNKLNTRAEQVIAMSDKQSPQQIADKMGVSKRTIFRDKNRLKEGK